MRLSLPFHPVGLITTGLLVFVLPFGAQADGMLRCDRDIVQTGDTIERVLEKCGPPREREKHCAPGVLPENVRILPNGCTPGERFVYTYEPSAVRKTVEFVDGKVFEIR